jgi:hypothetical protein
MKTTKEHLKIFEESVHKWMKRLHITGWQVFVLNFDGDHTFAQLGVNHYSRTATFRLCSNWDSQIPLTRTELEKTAFHEVCHLFLEPLAYLSQERYLTEDQLIAAVEEVTYRVEGVIGKVKW